VLRFLFLEGSGRVNYERRKAGFPAGDCWGLVLKAFVFCVCFFGLFKECDFYEVEFY